MSQVEVAAVRTLAAEVRVLMVGARQITLSVAKQLDQVDPYLIEPMGRIRLGDEVQMIGRHFSGRDLVRAKIPTRRWIDLEPPSPFHACSRNGASSLLRVSELTPRRLAERLQPVEYIGVDGDGFDCDHDPCIRNQWATNGQDEWLAGEVEGWLTDIARWESLPLIVLAGLR